MLKKDLGRLLTQRRRDNRLASEPLALLDRLEKVLHPLFESTRRGRAKDVRLGPDGPRQFLSAAAEGRSGATGVPKWRMVRSRVRRIYAHVGLRSIRSSLWNSVVSASALSTDDFVRLTESG